MIPVTDVIPRRTLPRITLTLLILSTAASVIWSSGRVELAVTVPPLLAPFLSVLLHAGSMHLAVNMICLWLFGPSIEDRMGHGRFLAFYLLCGALAAYVPLAAGLDRVSGVCSSTAIAGLMGAYFVQYPTSRILAWTPIPLALVEVPAFFFLGTWTLFQFAGAVGVLRQIGVSDTTGGIPFWVHMVVFVAGAALWFVFRRAERVRVEWWS
jgi:membrane associated rhomboid family serine protease